MLKVLVAISLIQLISLTAVLANSLLTYEEVEVISSKWSSIPVAVRQIEFLGESDNGTLDCSLPGFTHFRWQIKSKASAGPYSESSSLVLEGKIREQQSTITIGNGGLPMATELLVVSCEALVNGQPRFQIIWVINRLPMPLGYITDPRICKYDSKSDWDSCKILKWFHSSNCYYGDGKDYRGTEYTTKGSPPGTCQYWFLDKPNKIDDYDLDQNNGEHRYCRNPRDTNYWAPWCITMSTSPKSRWQYCHVQECSDCMYGNGDGTFALYPGRKFPKYKSRGMTTLKEEEDGLPRTCMTGSEGWETNTCQIRNGKKKPHCYIARKKSDETEIKTFDESDSRLELVECRIPQCTVRQVWFLFFDSFGRPYLQESNYEAVEIVMVSGRKKEVIKFGAFGIHLMSGLSVGTDDSKLTTFARTFELAGRLTTRRSAKPLSTIVVRNINKNISGNYFVQYTFAEANPKIQQSVFKANFKITVREPTTFTLSPKVGRVCRGEKGSFTVQVSGGFDVLENSIKWKHGTSEIQITQDISPDDMSFDLASDFRKVTVKAIQKETWVSVEGNSYSGHTRSTAQFKLKAQPHLKATSPVVQQIPLGGDVSLTLEVESSVKTTWMFDAQVIPDVPDDPSMAFQRTLKKNLIVESLVISDLDWRHFGMYIVDAAKDGCKETLTFHIELEIENETIPTNAELTTALSTTPLPTTPTPTELEPLINQEYCTLYPLKVRELQRGKEFTKTIDLKCNDHEQRSSLPDKSPVRELPSCCVVTSYQFISNVSIPHKLFVGASNPKQLTKYDGDVQVKLNFFTGNKAGGWMYIHNFAEPVATRYLQFVSEQTGRSLHLNKLQINGCPVDESLCSGDGSQTEDLTCNDKEVPLYNELPVHELSPCSLMTSYQFVAEHSISHTLLFSANSTLLMKYSRGFQIETRYTRGSKADKWMYIHKLVEPVPVRYIQFISDQTGSSACLDQLQIRGCTIDETRCSSDWFKTEDVTCAEQKGSLYDVLPVYKLPRCSLIASYQFVANTASPHTLRLSGNNSRLLLEYSREVYIESKIIKRNESEQWSFFYIFPDPFPTRYLQFICNETGARNWTVERPQCLRELQINGCPVADSLCNEDWFNVKVEVEWHILTIGFLQTTAGQFLLGMVIASLLFVVAMFFAAEYDIENLMARMLLKFREKNLPGTVKYSIKNLLNTVKYSITLTVKKLAWLRNIVWAKVKRKKVESRTNLAPDEIELEAEPVY